MSGLEVRIDFSQPVQSQSGQQRHFAWISVRDGKMHMMVGNGSGQVNSSPTTDEAKFFIQCLARAIELVENDEAEKMETMR